MVSDSASGLPLPGASIRILQSGKQVKGMVTADDGSFSIDLDYGTYRVETEHIGFNTFQSGIIHLNDGSPEKNLGRIAMMGIVNTLDEVIVQAEKSSMQLSLDKRIFNVGKDLANAGGTAGDILTNIPSVSVDPEGNVKLRGSDNVRILIDGKPSGLVSFKGGSGLQQLQASMVERVEIITNPSARYEAEGMAGIINIILRKDKKQGFNGSFELTGGQPLNLGAAANINYRHKKLNFFLNYGIAYRRTPGLGSLYQELYGGDTTFILKQNNKGRILGFNNNIRGGLDYYFSETSILTASYLFRRSDASRITDIYYRDYLFNLDQLASYTTRRQDEDEIEPNSEYSLIYKKNFRQKGHELVAEIKHLDNWESSDQLFTQQSFKPNGSEMPGKGLVQRSLNDEFERQWLFQIDYVKPIGKEGKFETGARSSFRNMVNDFIVTERNASGEFTALPGLDNIFEYDERIHALYGILGNKQKKLSYQAGLRAELTDVKTVLRETNEENPRDYINFFPSAHLTYDLPNENALQISYSRRVRRPFYNDLTPFVTFSDNRNFFSGNPDLEPEFSDVFEIGHIKYLEIGSLSSSLYYRNTDGKIDRIRSVDGEGNSITITGNLLSEKAMGAEMIATLNFKTWWKSDLSFNLFHAKIDGSNIQKNYTAETFSWFARYTSRFDVPGNIQIQFRGNYEAPQKTAQGKRRSLYYADIAASKDLFKGKGTVNLNVLDLFNTRKMRSVSEGPNFFTESDFQWRRRQINLTLSYRLNQAKPAAPKILAEE